MSRARKRRIKDEQEFSWCCLRGRGAGAERSGGERSEPQRSGEPVPAGVLPAASHPDPEGVARQALRVLRFLGSEASTRELARRFWFYDRQRQVHPISAEYPINPFFYGYERSQDYWDIKAGLIASPYRAVAIEALTAAIHDPQHPATRAMVETLALLEIQSKPEY